MAEEKKPQQPKRQPQFEVSNDLDAVYVNIVRIAHTPSEIMFDFARLLPGDRGAKVKSRVVMSPLSAKLLYRALADNLSKYEAAFGEISVPQKQSLADFLFQPPKGGKEGEEPDEEEKPE